MIPAAVLRAGLVVLPTLTLLPGCPVPLGPCGEGGPPEIELALEGHEFGSFDDGDPLDFFGPPQGGGPIVAYRLRLRGLDGELEGIRVTMTATDTTGVQAEEDTTRRFICSNEGPNDDHLVSAAFHLQFVGADPRPSKASRPRSTSPRLRPRERWPSRASGAP